MEIACATCKHSLEIEKITQFGYDVTLFVEGCDCQYGKDCDNCDKRVELEEEVMAPLVQANIDIEGNDEMIQKIRALGQYYGGEIEEKIEKILNKE